MSDLLGRSQHIRFIIQGRGDIPPLADVPRLSARYLVGSGSLPLFAAATAVGFASAAYWTFFRDLVVRFGDLPRTGSTVFWVVIGVSGLAGGLAGDLVQRFGLAGAFRASVLSMAAARTHFLKSLDDVARMREQYPRLPWGDDA
jgi:hypothetical protein